MSPAEWIRRLPWTIIVCALALMFVGLSGIGRGDELAAGGEFARRQMLWIVLSIPAMLTATLVPYRILRRFSLAIFTMTIFLLVLVYFLPARNGSHRWIPLGLFYFQPSEVAKPAYILLLSHYLMYRRNYRRLLGLLIPFLLTFIPVGLILREPDLGTSLLFIPVLFAMLFAAGARPRHLLLISLLGLLALPALWAGMNVEQRSRVVTVFTQQDGGDTPRGDGYHLHQSKRVLALGGVWGSDVEGMPIEDLSAYHLPAARTDFVFCLVGERWGLIGATITLGLYLVLFSRGLAIAAATREPFGRLLVVGIMALLAAQSAINTGMTVGLMPITGMTLPLMSYGGSSLLATCVSLGLVMNVAMRPGYEVSPAPFRFDRTDD